MGEVRCDICGRVNESSADHCFYCGEPIPWIAASSAGGEKKIEDVRGTSDAPRSLPEDKAIQATVLHREAADKSATADVPEIRQDHCPYCGSEQHIADAKFCANCGHPLDLDFDKCFRCKTPTVPGARFCFHCGLRIEPVPQLILQLIDTQEEFGIPRGVDYYVIGRTVPQQDIYVDLDLSEHGERRISRQHARFTLRENRWYVEDMNSKAGTRLFNRRLEPFVPVMVEDSNVIYFADIRCKVLVR